MPALRNGKRTAPSEPEIRVTTPPPKRVARREPDSTAKRIVHLKSPPAASRHDFSPPPSAQRPRKDSLQSTPQQTKKQSSAQGKRARKPPQPKSSPEDGRETHNTTADKENIVPCTPPHSSPFTRNGKTPGRVGPIKKENFDLSPHIEPFKGPKGKRVRKNQAEKDAEYRQFALDNEDYCFHELYVCHKKGPKGSPTYDKSGFQLDYKKVSEWMKPIPYNKDRMVKGMEKAVEKAQNDEARMREIFFEEGAAPDPLRTSPLHKDMWKDRVSKDLGIPYHKIGVAEFEEWERQGFPKAKKGEYEDFGSRKERIMSLASGSSLRK